jgi:hypothetical protein
MEATAGLAMCLAANCKNGISSYELHHCLRQRTTPSKHSRVVSKKIFVAIIIGLLFSFAAEAILAVQRPPYPIKAEKPDGGHWIIISTNEKTK